MIDLLEGVSGGVSNPLAQQLLLESYFRTYKLDSPGIDPSHPLYLSLFRPLEEVDCNQPLYNLMRRWAKHKLYEMHISLWDLLAMPRDMSEELFEIATAKAQINKAVLDDLENGLNGGNRK